MSEWGIWHLPSDSWEWEVFSTREEALAHCERNGETMPDGRMDIEPREVTDDEQISDSGRGVQESQDRPL